VTEELRSFPPFRLDAKNERLWNENQVVRLRRKTFAVLRHLVERPGELVTKAALLEAVWPDVSVSDSMPAISVYELRKALRDDADHPRFIETVEGRGYRFIATVKAEADWPRPRNTKAAPAPQLRAPTNRFVGRERERAELRGALADARGGRGRLVLVAGEPGIGKSRLCSELAAEASQAGMTLMLGHCSEQEAVPLLPFVEILESCIGGEDPEELRTMLGDEGPELARILPSLRRLIPNLAQPRELPSEQARRLLFDSVCNFISRHSRERPLLLIIEDLHWADDSTLGLFSHLSARHAELPLLLIGTHRPSQSDVGPALARALEDLVRTRRIAQVRLEGLQPSDVAEMLQGMSGKSPPAAVVAEFVGETDGNPFFVEELFRHLAEENRLYDSAGRYRSDLRIKQLDVPHNVRLVVGRRFARLDEATRRVLITAAVIGRSFKLDLLEAATAVKAAVLLDNLDEAAHLGLVRSSTEYADGRTEFSHELTRQVVLGQLSAARHERLHLETASAIERVYANSLEDHYAELAGHFGQTSNSARAAHYLCLAGRRALESSAHTEASALLSTALEKIRTLPESPERDRTELRAQIAVGDLTISRRGFGVQEVESAFGRAAELSRRLHDKPHLIMALYGLSSNYMLRSYLRKGLEMGREVLALSRDTDTPDHLATAYFGFAMPSFWLGDLEVAREYFEKILTMSDRLPRTVGERLGDVSTSTLQYLAWTLWYMGYPGQGLEAAGRALRIARERNHAFTLACALSQVARFHVLRREPTIAIELANQGLEFSERNNFPTWTGESTLVRGWALAQLGREEEGIAAMRAGLAIRDAIQEYGAQPHYQAWLAEALGRVGRVREGLDVVASCLDKEHEVLVYEPEVHLARASLHLAQDPPDITQAMRSTQAAIEVAHGYGGKSFELRATTSLARLLASQGHRKEARAMLAEIYGWFTEGFDTPDLKEAKALVDQLAMSARY
jgi:DNA-binding winged helix-turn-helix (wHTH) protein/tetratricopeptide (TPR) repeat protein